MDIPRKMVERYSERFHVGFMSSTAGKLKDFLNTQEIPNEATLAVEMGYDNDVEALYFVYEELEKDEEYEARCKKTYYEQKRIADDELKMYKILKNKFEGEQSCLRIPGFQQHWI